MILNKLYNKVFYTTNNRSHFHCFTILTVKEITDYQGGSILETVTNIEDYLDKISNIDDPFYMVLGTLKPNIMHNVGSDIIIGSFDNLSDAILLVETLRSNDEN